tara:strand:+ start:2590 stop:3228 length:639 start_codon:yes stop_codon:yes gene_type:complete
MRNNLAELKDVSINIESLRAAWAEQLVFSGDFEWGKRNYVELDFFTAYFQHLLVDIENVIGRKPKDYIIQLHDRSIPSYTDTLYNDKFYLGIIHKDEYRTSCVNIPVYYDKMEPVHFYNDEDVMKRIEEYEIYTHDGLPRIALMHTGGLKNPLGIIPNQIGQYSENHPTLMNVQNWHNVRVMELAPPRIFIQMSYDIHFDEIVAKDINTRIL